MCSLGCYLAVVQHENLVGINDAADSLGDKECGSSFQFVLEGFLQAHLGIEVDRARAVIEDQDGRLCQQRACNGNTLFLPTGKIGPACLDHTFRSPRATA